MILPIAQAGELEGEAWDCHIIDGSSRGADGVKLADINGDRLMDITTGWEEGGITRVYLNPGPKGAKQPWPVVTVGKTPSVEDAVFVDLDGDGALDVISSCEGKERSIFVHWAPQERDALLTAEAWKQELLPVSKELGQQWMYVMPMQVDGKHGTDLIAGSKGKGGQVGWFEAPKNGRDLANYRWHPITAAGWIMSIWPRDMDGDGDMDVVVSDRQGALRGCHWLENPGPGDQQKEPWPRHPMGAHDQEVMSMSLADIDRDGLLDAVVACKGMKVLWLKRLDAAGRQWRTHVISADFNAGNTRAVAVAYLNPDNHPDLLITTWNAAGKHGVFWLEGDGSPEQGPWQAHPISGTEKGIKYDRIELLDIDGDGGLDLLTCEEREGGRGMGVFWYKNPIGKAQP